MNLHDRIASAFDHPLRDISRHTVRSVLGYEPRENPFIHHAKLTLLQTVFFVKLPVVFPNYEQASRQFFLSGHTKFHMNGAVIDLMVVNE